LFTQCPLYNQAYRGQLKSALPEVEPAMPRHAGHRAALEFGLLHSMPSWLPVVEQTAEDFESPTESRRSGIPLDEHSPAEVVEVMCQEESRTADSVAAALPEIAVGIEMVRDAFLEGGRLIYVGAGTSGRLGVLDAAECPPTFGVPPGQVMALIAGGDTALVRSVEGAEDDEDQAMNDLGAIDPPVSGVDIVCGITASGTTPYVRAALDWCGAQGIATILVTCNPAGATRADNRIVIDLGPEVVAGSTRLKAGTATKLVLNQLTTGAMALSGRVYKGLMVGMVPVNEKLRRRAERIIAELTGTGIERSRQLLEDSGNNIRLAVLMGRLKVGVDEASRLLEAAKGSLRVALENSQRA